jgi:superfamily II DNA or RNA helicase
MNLDKLISRFDVEIYQSILGNEIIGTLKELGSEYLYTAQLNSILNNTYSTGELLLNSTFRKSLFQSMKKQEIENLNLHLGVNNQDDPWKAIENITFKGLYLEKLFEFFHIEIPEENMSEWIGSHKVNPEYALYNYQNKVLFKIDMTLKTSKNRVLLHMPTGSGKTRTTISYICRYFIENENTNVVWFANTVELLDQAYNEFKRAWTKLGNREIQTYKFWGQSDIDLSIIQGSFVVVGLDKAYNFLLNDFGNFTIFANNTSLIIMDEAHQAIAPTYKLLLESIVILNKASLIGLSATPGRSWNDPNEDLKLADFFYRQKVKLKIDGYENPVDYLVENGYLARTINTPLLYKSGIELSLNDIEYLRINFRLPPNVLDKISKDRLRNLNIISKVQNLIKKHKRIIIFGITKDHAIILNSLLTALRIDSKVLTSDTQSEFRKKIIEDFKTSRIDHPEPKVLCNFGILTTGFDAPETSCAVIARPTDSLVLYSQMVGRAIRGVKSGGNEEAEIVTVIDESLPGFGNVAEAFSNWDDVWDEINEE